MSLEIKVSFLNELENVLQTKITSQELRAVMSSASDVLQNYDFTKALHTDNASGFDFLNAYVASLKVQCRSEKTIERYKYVINRLVNSLQIPIRSITVYHLREWIAKEQSRGVSDSTLEGQRQIFSAFFGWLLREGLIEKNPVANLGAIKVQKKVRKIFTDIEIENLKAACVNIRDKAIISFLLSTGCRINEVVGLNRNQINFIDKEVIVLGKGNKERTVFFDDVTAMHLKRYLETRKDDIPALFIGKRKERLLPGGVRYMLNQLAKTAGVEHVHPHKFRRTLATTMNAHGMPIQEVSAILGHERLDTTMKYVIIDKATVKNSYRKYA